MPGTIVQTFTSPAPAERVRALGATFFVAGLTERGDTVNAVPIKSLKEYQDYFGDRVAYGSVYDALACYFGEGGTRAYIARLAGSAATLGTLMLKDRSTGAGINTLRIDALSAGAWSTRISITIEDGSVANTFRLTVSLDGTAAEVYNNLASPAAAAAALLNSNYVRGTDQASATAASNNNPKVLTITALSAGTDDRGSLVAADYVTALDRFGSSLGPGSVAIPGFDSTLVGAGLIAHAKAKRRIALLATPSGQTPTQARTAAIAFANTSGAEHAGLFYPWVQIDDGAGGIRTISPEGYVAGVRARANVQEGPWRAPAGDIAAARFVTGVERVLTRTEVDSANDDRVCCIRLITGNVRLYGWRSLSLDTVNYRLLTGRDVLNEVAGLGAIQLERYVFGTIDGRGHFFEQLANEMRSILEPMRIAGGLYERIDPNTGDQIDLGYVIDTGPSVNTSESIGNDEARVAVGLRVSPSAELIYLLITKVSFESNL